MVYKGFIRMAFFNGLMGACEVSARAYKGLKRGSQGS